MNKMALEGITVADFGHAWAGPQLGKTFGDMGARVIKVESQQRIDVTRFGPFPKDAASAGLDDAGYFNWMNRNKFGVTLNLATPRGVELAKEIIKISDILVENFSRGVMKKYGLDYESLKEVNPKIIYVALTALGSDGPFKDYVMYGRPQIYLSGLAHITGYPDKAPHPINISWGDPVGAHFGTFAALSALYHRKKTGKGQYIDISQWEGLISISPENILDYTLNDRVRERRANRHEFMAPHNAYRCAGGDLKWVTIAVKTDDEWKSLCKAMGNPDWTKDEKFVDALSRWSNQEEMDRHIEEWTMTLTGRAIMELLQKEGVAAFPTLSNRELAEDPHLNERRFFYEIDHPNPATKGKKFDGVLWKMNKTPGKIRQRAPLLGEHNNYVFGELLGISEEEISQLTEEKVLF